MSNEVKKRFGSATRTGAQITIVRAPSLMVFTLVRPPFPKVGDTITFRGADWTVKRVEKREILAVFPRGAAKVDGDL